MGTPEQASAGEGEGFRVRARRRSAALTLYFDTSALVKLVVAEDGSELVAELWDSSHPVASSVLAYPEGRAALAAARRAGRLTSAGHRKAVEDIEAIFAELLVVGIDEELARRASELADELGLRGYDAVHLASALALGPATTFVTWDADLSAAAHESGLAVAPPP